MDEERELFNSALDATPAEAPAEQPAPKPEQIEGDRPRDEHGRFAPRSSEAPEPVKEVSQEASQPQEAPQPRSDAIPPWRLREEAEARRAAEARLQEYERDMAQMRAYIEQQTRQREQAQQPVPDIFENPTAFVEHGVRQAVDPVQGAVRQMREYYSQVMAQQRYGEDTVKQAYDAMDQALRGRDPDATATYQRMQNALDPYGEMVKWHRKSSVLSTIGDDPDKWFEKRLEERAKDPTFQAQLLERIRGNVSNVPGRPASLTQLPPSLNRVTSSAPASDDGDDLSDAGLLKSALRR